MYLSLVIICKFNFTDYYFVLSPESPFLRFYDCFNLWAVKRLLRNMVVVFVLVSQILWLARLKHIAWSAFAFTRALHDIFLKGVCAGITLLVVLKYNQRTCDKFSGYNRITREDASPVRYRRLRPSVVIDVLPGTSNVLQRSILHLIGTESAIRFSN